MSDCYGFLRKERTGGQYRLIYDRHIAVNGFSLISIFPTAFLFLLESIFWFMPLKKTGRSVGWNVVIKTGVICLGVQKYHLNQRITSKNQNQRNANYYSILASIWTEAFFHPSNWIEQT